MRKTRAELEVELAIAKDTIEKLKKQNDPAFQAEVQELFNARDVRNFDKKMSECVPYNKDGNIDLGDVLDALKKVVK